MYKNGQPFALVNSHERKDNFSVKSFEGRNLLDIYFSKRYLNGKPGYIVKFKNDEKSAFTVISDKLSIKAIQKFIIGGNFIISGLVNDNAEDLYVAAHPLPLGYIDTKDFFDDIDIDN